MPDQIREAANSLWGKPLDSTTADSIGGTERCAQAMRQFLETYPVTAAMTFAMTFGYQLRLEVEKREREAASRLVRLI